SRAFVARRCRVLADRPGVVAGLLAENCVLVHPEVNAVGPDVLDIVVPEPVLLRKEEALLDEEPGVVGHCHLAELLPVLRAKRHSSRDLSSRVHGWLASCRGSLPPLGCAPSGRARQAGPGTSV